MWYHCLRAVGEAFVVASVVLVVVVGVVSSDTVGLVVPGLMYFGHCRS